MPIIAQYEIDTNGTSADNKITDEVHTLVKGKKLRAVSPLKGAFYTSSMKIKNKITEEYLVPLSDYIFVELYESLSIKYNKDIAGVVIITNAEIQGDYVFEYQVVGGYFNPSTEPLSNFINNKSAEVLSIEKWAELNNPGFFLPSPLVHELGTNYGFEYAVYAIERIRSAVMRADSSAYDYILNYIKDFISGLIDLINNEIDVNLKDILNEYKRKLTKALAGLDKVQNLSIASEEEGRIYATKDWRYQKESDNKYIITSVLSAFKEVLYSVFVPTDTTGIGKYKGVVATPVYATMFNMTNGTRYVFDTLESVQLSKIPYDFDVYPNTTISDAKWIVYKVINNPEDRGGVFLSYNLKTSEIYSGILSSTSTGTPVLNWIRHITRKDANEYIQKLIDHMEDTDNPHSTVKFHVGLGDVENLTVVTREDIICRKPVRKYVTYDALLLFWKLYLKDVKQLGDKEDADEEITVAERFRLIFAPCGPCGTQPYTPPPPTPAAPAPIEPRDKLLAAWCTKYDKYGRFSDGFGGTYEKLIEAKSVDCRFIKTEDYKERGTLLSTYCEGTASYGKYADGKGSFYVSLIAEDSSDCGGISTGDYVLVEIRDLDNILFGYGYITTRQPADPDATVMLTDIDGDGICYIFPSPKAKTLQGHEATVEIKDADGTVIGYAIKA